ncbi:SpoIIE family protein phosphatase [Fervidobacterium islandicum]|uniref:SpoIIE family protein phosphatase n=1 Tax=Fervidobacterium islandicum TaxID=2423 RepID=UPI003A67A121
MPSDRVVIFTDSPDNIQDIVQLLEFVGYDVSIESDVSTFLKNNNIQVVLVYYQLLKNAQEVVRYIKTTQSTKDIPVIVLIQEKNYVTLLELYQIGISDYIEFPIIDVELISKIALHIELKKNREKIESLYKELRESLDLASSLQTLMLPEPIEMCNGIWITSNYMPSQIVGGDIYDYFSLNEDVYLYTADISGHGVQSALLCSAVKSVIRSAAQRGLYISEVVNELQDSMKTVLGHNYVTGLFLKIRGSKVEYINCGHPPLIIYDGANFTTMNLKSVFPIGLLDYRYTPEDCGSFEMQEGLTFVAYSDGLYSIFERIRASEDSMQLLLEFLNKEISGIMPEALPFATANALRRRYYEIPDDYSFIAFGRSFGSAYYSENSKYEMIPFERTLKSLVDDIILRAADHYAVLINDHGKFWSIATKNVEIGPILRKLPMSITISFDTVECIKVFKNLR